MPIPVAATAANPIAKPLSMDVYTNIRLALLRHSADDSSPIYDCPELLKFLHGEEDQTDSDSEGSSSSPSAIDLLKYPELVALKNPEGLSAAHWVAQSDQPDLIGALFEPGTEHHKTTDARGWTPLMYAAMYGCEQAVRALTKLDPEHITLKNADGLSALDIAIQRLHVECVTIIANGLTQEGCKILFFHSTETRDQLSLLGDTPTNNQILRALHTAVSMKIGHHSGLFRRPVKPCMQKDCRDNDNVEAIQAQRALPPRPAKKLRF